MIIQGLDVDFVDFALRIVILLELVQVLRHFLALLVEPMHLSAERLELAVQLVVLVLQILDLLLVLLCLVLELDDVIGADLKFLDLRLAFVHAGGLDLVNVLLVEPLHLILQFL